MGVPASKNRAQSTREPPRVCWVRQAAAASLVVPDQSFTVLEWDTVIRDDFDGFNISSPDRITLPDWVEWVKVFGHVTFAPQLTPGAVDGTARMHLFRNGLPTNEDAHYHNVLHFRAGYAPPAQAWLLSFEARTPWIPRYYAAEYWTLPVWQSTGEDASVTYGLESWLHIEVK